LDNQRENACNKNAKSAGNLAAGTLLFWCAEHRYCIGFVILTEAESCRQLYEVLVTRFIVFPKTIMYDNGCNLHDYILNRSPQLFKETMILSDGFHWKNHTNCSSTYNSKAYSYLNGKLVINLRYLVCVTWTKEPYFGQVKGNQCIYELQILFPIGCIYAALYEWLWTNRSIK